MWVLGGFFTLFVSNAPKMQSTTRPVQTQLNSPSCPLLFFFFFDSGVGGLVEEVVATGDSGALVLVQVVSSMMVKVVLK